MKKGSSIGRKIPVPRGIHQTLILCEDEKSSCDYFTAFYKDLELARVECAGTGKNTDSLMQEAIDRNDAAIKAHRPFRHIWVVFDRDSFPLENFNRAFEQAKDYNNITACWSNECFELWYLLHFDYLNTGIGRKDLKDKLSGRLKKKYDKADVSIYNTLKDRLEIAMKHARILERDNLKMGTPHGNPSTHIHKLIEDLESLKKINRAEGTS